MVFSMTGFGRESMRAGDTVVSVEVRSVNHRYSDISVRTLQVRVLPGGKDKAVYPVPGVKGKGGCVCFLDMGDIKETDIRVNYDLAQNYYSAPGPEGKAGA